LASANLPATFLSIFMLKNSERLDISHLLVQASRDAKTKCANVVTDVTCYPTCGYQMANNGNKAMTQTGGISSHLL
jgi:hypothetical protein